MVVCSRAVTAENAATTSVPAIATHEPSSRKLTGPLVGDSEHRTHEAAYCLELTLVNIRAIIVLQLLSVLAPSRMKLHIPCM